MASLKIHNPFPAKKKVKGIFNRFSTWPLSPPCLATRMAAIVFLNELFFKKKLTAPAASDLFCLRH